MKKNIWLCTILLCSLFIYGQKKNYSAKQVDSLFYVGDNFYSKSDYYNSLQELRQALVKAEKIKNDTLITKICNRIGRNFAQIKNLEFGDYFFNKALSAAKKTNDINQQILILNNLGNLFTAFKEKKENQVIAIKYYLTGLTLAKKNNLTQDICLINMNVTWAYLRFKEYDKAKPYLVQFTKLHPEFGKKYFNNIVYMLTATYYEGKGELLLAEQTYNKGLTSFSKELLFKEKKSEYLYRYSELLLKLKNNQKSKFYLKKADSINEIFYNKEVLKKANESSASIILDAFKLDKQKADFEIKTQENNLEQNRLVTFISLLFLALISILSLYLFKLYKSKNTVNQQLTLLNLELEKAKLAAEESNDIKSKFISTITHELRTPLYGVIGLTDVMDNSNLDQINKNYVKSLKFSAKHLLSLVNDILQISKLDSKEAKLENSVFDIHQEIESVKENLLHIAKQNNNTIEIDISSKINKFVLSDEVKFSQILYNLGSNALKFTKNGKVVLKAELFDETQTNQQIKFSIIDNGVGISKENLDAIFEKFVQIKTEDNFYEGTGLGLVIVNDILKLYNSKIELTSVLGKGSIFSFVINLEKANEIIITEIQSIDAEISSLQILIVDDNKINQVVTQKTIQNLKCFATAVDSGFQAIEIVKNQYFDIVLMDINMPVIDGYETTKEIRKFNTNIPIIALTAFDKNEILPKAILSGISDILVKPYHSNDLLKILKKFQKNIV